MSLRIHRLCRLHQTLNLKPSHETHTRHAYHTIHKQRVTCHNTIYGHHVSSRNISAKPPDFPESLHSLPHIEKLVDSPVTFLGIDFLQNDEIFYLLENIQKLIGTKHPIVEFGAQTLLSSTGTFKVHGLIVLLLAQIINSSVPLTLLSRDETRILPKQRRLVEVCEMVSTAFFLHDNIVNVGRVNVDQKRDIEKGNKLSLLFGDYFLATACSQLATMENPDVVDSVSKAIAHNVEGRFWLETINVNNPPHLDDLSYYCSLRYGALMSSCCYSSALLSGLNSEAATSLMAFGNHIGQAIHLKNEIFSIRMKNFGVESLSSYPFISAAKHLHTSGKTDIFDLNSELNEEYVQTIVNLGYGIELTSEKCEYHCNAALESLKLFNVSDEFGQNLANIVGDIKSCKPIVTM